jgi:hypothetical protein
MPTLAQARQWEKDLADIQAKCKINAQLAKERVTDEKVHNDPSGRVGAQEAPKSALRTGHTHAA